MFEKELARMKAGKKRGMTRARSRATETRDRLMFAAVSLALTLLVVVLLTYSFYTFWNQPQNQPSNSEKQNNNASSSQLRAAIVDQLSLTYPDQLFVENVTNTLKRANYTVDYYPGEEVTVEFFKSLPAHGYRLVILRVHSSATSSDMTEAAVAFFTSERYDRSKYVYEQATGQLDGAAFSLEEMQNGIMYFSIDPPFITHSMKGRFNETTFVVMGCEGLRNAGMAEAFVERGARAYISWSDPVSVSHTDTATASLLRRLLIGKQTIDQAVYDTVTEVGLDPTYGSNLGYYPPSVGNEKAENAR
jgi:flagellar basal body-associated protein FliL